MRTFRNTTGVVVTVSWVSTATVNKRRVAVTKEHRLAPGARLTVDDAAANGQQVTTACVVAGLAPD